MENAALDSATLYVQRDSPAYEPKESQPNDDNEPPSDTVAAVRNVTQTLRQQPCTPALASAVESLKISNVTKKNEEGKPSETPTRTSQVTSSRAYSLPSFIFSFALT